MNFKREILDLYNSQEYESLMAIYNHKSAFDILGVARDEKAHSNFLAWLFNSNESHGYGTFPTQKFLQMLVNAANAYPCNQIVKIDSELENSLLVGTKTILSVKAEREKKINGGFIDILLEITFDNDQKSLPVIIENKVMSDEHSNSEKKPQTERYFEWAQKKYEDTSRCYAPIFVFLTPKYDFKTLDAEQRKMVCKNPSFLLISYQDILDFVVEPCLKNDGSKTADALLKDYIVCLGFKNISEQKGELTMAVSQEEKTLLKQFWDKNENLFLQMIEVLQEDSSIDEEKREIMKDFSNGIQEKHNNDIYIFCGETYKKCPLPKAVVKKYAADKNCDFEALEKAFPKILQGSLGVFKELSQISDKQNSRFYCNDPIKLSDGKTVAVCNQWAAGKSDNISGFIEYVNENLGSDYKIELKK